MTKQQLALQYFPDTVSETAVRHLMRWINGCRPLTEALAGTGYQSRNRSLTWRQVLLIRDFLGEPAEPEERFRPSLPSDGHKRT